jgi:hypothetical protein
MVACRFFRVKPHVAPSIQLGWSTRRWHATHADDLAVAYNYESDLRATGDGGPFFNLSWYCGIRPDLLKYGFDGF